MQRVVLILCLAVVACHAKRFSDDNENQVPVRTEMTESCDENFVAIAGMCYHFEQNRASWADARIMCQTRNSRLASVLTTDQYEGLIAHINSNYPGTYWTSGKYEGGQWLWTSLEKPVSSQWWGRTPTATANQCVYFCTFTHKYWSKSCSNNVRFICEKPMERVIREIPAV